MFDADLIEYHKLQIKKEVEAIKPKQLKNSN
jgi:hypothetical protein